jgi:multiple sugar transport system permease protein
VMVGRRSKVWWYVPVLLILAIWLFPIAWIVLTSFKSARDLVGLRPSFVFSPTFDNYIGLFRDHDYGFFLQNSLLIAGGTTVVSMLLSCLAAYGLLHIHSRASEQLAMWILSLRMLPPIATVVPFYLVFNRAHLLDTYPGMLLAYLSFSLPFAIWMLQGFFAEVPASLQEAAAADGAGPLKILFNIILPLSRGGIAVTAIFTFIFAWNEFLFAFLLTEANWTTLPVALGKTSTPYQTDWGTLGAGGVVSFLPLVIVVFLLQREMVRGVTFGTVK